VSRIGAPAAEPRSDRDLLVDPDAPPRLDAGSAPELLEGAADERVAGKAVDPKGPRFVELDPVDQVDLLQNGENLVLTVVTRRPDNEREVDLGRRRGSHRSASASATKSSGGSASARISAG
jgi:hypothetical protein